MLLCQDAVARTLTIYVSDIVGQALQQDPEYWPDDFHINIFQDENPNIQVWETLEKEALTKKSISKLLSHFKEAKELENRNKRPKEVEKLTSEVVIKRISSNERMIIRPQEKNDLSNSDITILAAEFRKQTLPVKVEKYLSIFRLIKYPDSPDDIIQLVNTNTRKNTSIYEQALYALEKFQSTQVRDFALNALKNNKKPEVYLDLLRLNYYSEDNEILCSLARRFRNLDKIELLAGTCISIMENFEKVDLSPVIEILYRKMNCGICRNSLFNVIFNCGSLPEWISEEIKYDSYEATRLLSNSKKDSLKEIFCIANKSS